MQRYLSENFYVFTRGDVVIALTNSWNGQGDKVYLPDHQDGTVLCDALGSGDCQTVSGNSIEIYLNDHESKVFVPESRTPTQ